MKKLIISMLMIASCFGVANAQLMVDETGKAAIGYEGTETLKSTFSINDVGDNDATMYIRGSIGKGLHITNSLTTTGSAYGIYCHNAGYRAANSYGIYSLAAGISANRRVSVYGTTGTLACDYDYGVAGRLKPSVTTNGAAIYGSTLSNTAFVNITGLYAGYFCGNTYVTGTLTAGSVVTTSDYRLKDNIRPLSSSDGCLGKLMDMNVVEFNYKQREYEVSASDLNAEVEEFKAESAGVDSTTLITMSSLQKSADIKVHMYEEESPIVKNKHYGLIAQELQEIYPDLVIENQDGYLAINYTEIIPLLIRSVQELNAKVEQYENAIVPVYKAQTRTADAEATAIDAIVTTLYQNTPNPFTESTLIRCDVADDVVKADLYIYNMNGEQIAEYSITERGETSVTIDGGSLNAGMYLYALIVDGQVIDTKRMILTR